MKLPRWRLYQHEHCDANYLYGSIDVLSTYAGIYPTQRFHGRIQHGFLPPFLASKNWSKSSLYQLTWSQNVEKYRSIAIGSPFLYLDVSAMPEYQSDAKSGGTLIAAPHGGVYNSFGAHFQSPEKRFDRVRQMVSRQSADELRSILLYWHDFINPEIRKLYESLSLPLVCAGFPGLSGNKFASKDVGGRSTYLHALREILGNFSLLTVLEPSSVAIYAAYLGLGVSVYSDDIGYEVQHNLLMQSTEKSLLLNRHNFSYQMEVMESLAQAKSSQHRKALASSFLGENFMKDRSELAQILKSGECK